MTNGCFLDFLKIQAKWGPSEFPCLFLDFTCFCSFLAKTTISWGWRLSIRTCEHSLES